MRQMILRLMVLTLAGFGSPCRNYRKSKYCMQING